MQGMSKEGEKLTDEVGFEYYYTASVNCWKKFVKTQLMPISSLCIITSCRRRRKTHQCGRFLVLWYCIYGLIEKNCGNTSAIDKLLMYYHLMHLNIYLFYEHKASVNIISDVLSLSLFYRKY